MRSMIGPVIENVEPFMIISRAKSHLWCFLMLTLCFFVGPLLRAETSGGEPSGLKPPPLEKTPIGFQKKELPSNPLERSQYWEKAQASEGTPLNASNGEFSLKFGGSEPIGDLMRSIVVFEKRGQSIQLTAAVAWAYITPDSRYVIWEPLTILDVKAWKKYDVSEDIDIPNYVTIEGIGRDHKRLLISWVDGIYEGAIKNLKWYEITLP
jgi:hypothetical protein